MLAIRRAQCFDCFIRFCVYRNVAGSSKNLVTLAIETSCDDTSVAILEKYSVPESNDEIREHGIRDSKRSSATSIDSGDLINQDIQGNNDARTAGNQSISRPQAALYFHKKITADNRKYKGIHPMIALASHQVNLAHLVQEALQSLPRFVQEGHGTTTFTKSLPIYESSGQGWTLKRKPDFISVTRGPGISSSLSTGVDTAKGLAVAWQVPLVGVHHMQAHSLTPRLVSALESAQAKSTDPDGNLTNPAYEPTFPYLSLLVSGGHTLVVHTASLTSHTILATTLDIAVGDCLDKCARDILPATLLAASAETMYGRLLEHFVFPSSAPDYTHAPPLHCAEDVARNPTKWDWTLTAPLAETRSGSGDKRMAFSFSGIGSTVKRIMERRTKEGDMSDDERKALGREVMEVAFEHLASRAIMALEKLQNAGSTSHKNNNNSIKTIVVSGGVASNRFLRHILRSSLDCRGFAPIELRFPPVELCTDNAAMIGWAAMEMYEAGWESELGIQAVRKWSLDPDAEDGGILGLGGWRTRGNQSVV